MTFMIRGIPTCHDRQATRYRRHRQQDFRGENKKLSVPRLASALLTYEIRYQVAIPLTRTPSTVCTRLWNFAVREPSVLNADSR